MNKLKECNFTIEGINGYVLKLIASIVMLIDHFAASVLMEMMNKGYLSDLTTWNSIYHVLRCIGRTAFPVYCFLMVEGFFYTHNRVKYMIRLAIFSLISEIPFDYAIFGNFDWSHQNVYFTLLIGYLAIWGCTWLEEKLAGREIPLSLAKIATMLVACMVAVVLHTDYSMNGVILIIILYGMRKNRLMALVLGYISFLWEAWCFPGFLLCLVYDGKRGKSKLGEKKWVQYAFYAFYPVHLAILAIWVLML